MAVLADRVIFMLIFIDVYGCTVIKRDVYTCCEDIFANGTYKYSTDSNWTTNKLYSEEWVSEKIPLAFIEYGPFSRNSSAEVQVLSGSIHLKRCLNLTYSATDDKFKEIRIRFIVMGCIEEKQNNASEVTSNLRYLAVLVPIIGLACILGIEWKIGCLRRRFSRHKNGRRQPADDQNVTRKDKETFC